MKLLVVIASVLVCVLAQNEFGIPIANCKQGEHSVLYCPQKAEPSCDNPKVHDLKYPGPCDIPQCFCDTPSVRNLKTGKCVQLTDC